MSWTNIGDMDPKSGTTLVRDLELEPGGDFRGAAVEVTPESHVGGSRAVFDLRQGALFLSAANVASALAVVGAELEGREIVRQDHHGGEDRIAIDSREGLLELANAANAYAGIEPDGSVLVRIGLPDRYEPAPRFDGDPVVYPDDASLWSIMRRHLDGFDHAPEDNPRDVTPFDTEDGPFAGMPRSVETRADLMKIGGFSHLEADAAGNPKIYELDFEHDGCREAEPDEDSGWQDWPEWTETCTASAWEEGVTSECPECGDDVKPHACRPIGPDEVELQNLHDDLPDAEIAAEPAAEPDF